MNPIFNCTGCLGIQFMQGFSHLSVQEFPTISQLTYELDRWIDRHPGLPVSISVSEDFKRMLDREAGYEVKTLDTLVGTFELETHELTANLPIKIHY